MEKGCFWKEMMMKKLLALTLVLGLATVASAVITITPISADVPDGTSVTIVISSDNPDPYGMFLEMTDPAGTLGNAILLPAAGADGVILDPVALGVPGTWMFQALSFNIAAPIIAGDHFTIDYTANDGQSLVGITVYDFDFVQIGRIEMQNTPEPMTLGLLGLGGLFLRRRR
jgi:hypothetical protein